MKLFKAKKSSLNWLHLKTIEDLELAITSSEVRPVLLFKHSTRCSISTMAKDRLERNWSDDIQIESYYLDLLQFRNVSDKIAEIFNVEHQSPQVMIISNRVSIYDASHNQINVDSIKDHIA